MTTCTFCRIIKGELPASKVFESQSLLAFLDIHPINPGHTLVVAKRHVESFTDLTADEIAAITGAAQLVAKQLKLLLPWCEGVSLSLADGVAAGQEVPHAHLHVIPRKSGDGFGWRFPPGFGEAASREALDSSSATIKLIAR
jgi:histidine triad (HIT) family protein